MRFLWVVLVQLISLSISAQAKLIPFGKPDLGELQLKEYNKDKNATALKLLDYQESEMIVEYSSIIIRSERRVKLKIFNSMGYEYANISIPYMSRNKSSKIKDITAYIHSLDADGKIVTQKIEKKQIFKEKSDDGYSRISFTFPNLKPGCVVEYRYTKLEKNSVHLDPWFFQDKIPTLLSICKIITPSQIEVNHRVIPNIEVKKEFKSESPNYLRYSLMNRSFSLQDVPPFKPEPFMSSVKDNLHRIEFSVRPSFGLFSLMMFGNNRWKVFTAALYKAPFFGEQFDQKITGAESIIDSAKKIEKLSEKVDFIFQSTKKAVLWDHHQTFYSGDIAEAWKTGSGNSAEINFILLNLLRKSGVAAYPLLVSTRSNGKPDKDFPSLGQFNGVDVLVMDSTEVFVLDGTQKYQSYTIPPLNVLNREALIVDTAIGKWVTITDPRPLMRNNMLIRASMDEKGAVTGNVTVTYYDLAKLDKLSEDEDEEEEDEETFISKVAGDLKIDSLIEENRQDEGKPLVQKYQFTSTLSSSDNYFFLDPFFLSSFRKNPFTDSTRMTTLDFGSNQEMTITLYLMLPETFTIDHLPTSRLYRMEDSSILFKVIYDKGPNMVMFRNTFQLQRPVYDKDEYPGVKEFFANMYAIVNEQVVLKKK